MLECDRKTIGINGSKIISANNEHLVEVCYQLSVILSEKITNIKNMWAKYNCIAVGINVS
jgi:hypothetical protein